MKELNKFIKKLYVLAFLIGFLPIIFARGLVEMGTALQPVMPLIYMGLTSAGLVLGIRWLYLRYYSQGKDW